MDSFTATRTTSRLQLCAAAFCIASWLWLGASDPAHADDANRPSALSLEAHAEHERGIQAFSQGRYADAIEAFQHADQLWPNPALSYNVARAYEQLHDDVRAMNHYREYLRRAPRAPDRDAVTAQIERLAKHLGESELQDVRFDAEPRGATVWIDDEPVGTTPATVRLLTGKHRASFRLDGYETRELEVEVPHGRPAPNITVALEPAQDTIAEPSARSAASLSNDLSVPRDSDFVSQPLLRDLGVSAMLAGVGAFGGAMVFELMRADAERNAKRQVEQIKFAEALDKVESRQTLARVFAGAGGGLALIGVTLMVLSRTTSGHDTSSNTRVALHCAPAKCRAELTGTF